MAKKPRRKRVRLIKGTLEHNLVLATLAAAVGILEATDTVVDRSYLLSVEATYAIEGMTQADGPIKLYWAHSDYTLAEIEQYIESTTAWSDADEISKEISRRKIRQVGVIGPPAVTGAAAPLADGMPVKTKIGFVVNEGQGLNLVAYNDGGAALTTGAVVRVDGHCWIKPQ